MTSASGSSPESVELEELYELLYFLPVGIVAFDTAGSISRVTPLSMQLMNPFVAPSAISNAFAMLAPLVPELSAVIQAHDGGTVVLANHRTTLAANGSVITVEASVHRPHPDYFVAILSDVSELVRQEQQLRRERDRTRLIVEMIREYAIFTVDLDGRIDSWNTSGERLFGLSTAEAINRSLDEIVSESKLSDALEAATSSGWHRTEGWALCFSAGAFYTDTMISTLVDEAGQPEGFIVVVRDATEMRRRELDLRREAETDPLTKLANRRGFDTRADSLLQACAVNVVPIAVLMIDIDHFKVVNDTYGHDGGDVVLCAVAALLESRIRSIDLLARFGGEEFTVLMPGADLAAAFNRAEALRAAIAELAVTIGPGVVGGVTISIGVAQHNGSLFESLQRADVALYLAKNNGRNRVVCDTPSAPTPLTPPATPHRSPLQP